MGGGGSGKAQKEADAAERERQRQIKESTSQIQAIFDSPERQAQYDKLAADTTQFYTQDLDRQNVKAQRNLKFSLARSGLAGGSEQAYEGKQLGEDYQRGIVQASQRGQQAASSLQGQDASTEQSLIAMAQAGLDTTTASREAASSLRANVEGAQANSTAQGLGDIFSDVNSTYQSSLDAKNARAGQKWGYGSLYSSPLYGPGGQQPAQQNPFY